MRARSIVPYLILAAVMLSVTAIIYAGPEGKIIGTIIAHETGEPVAGASVLVVGTTKGAVTDSSGSFVIRQLEPGTYQLKISSLAYNTVTIDSVVVVADEASLVSTELTPKQTNELGQAITVKENREIVDKRITQSQVKLDKTTAQKPVTTVGELLQSVSGAITNSQGEVYIRGGRAGEVEYKRRGAPIGDPLGGRSMPPSHGGTAIVNGEPFDAMFFKNYGVNPFVDTEDDHLSTFAIDVDDASYVMTRSYLSRGALPPNEAVRTEEFVNHFKYNYAAPHNSAFKVYLEGAPSKFGKNCDMLKIGIKGMEVDPQNRKAANLVFVIDVSGSMGIETRLALVKRALRMLVDELTPQDRVGIVIYGSSGEVILEPTSIRHKHRILTKIEFLHTGGSTNAEEGIRLGYEMADKYFEKGKINRVILCTDGVANVGLTGADGILNEIKRYVDKGITLSAIGFGMNNYNDVLLEKLGDKGNGHYAYVDNLQEAHRIFVDNLTGNLQVIARDVKIQVDFNPEVVRSYRLLGYENRDVDDNKFRDDKEDGGEIGAGHEVTALYEIKFNDVRPEGNIGTVYIRYKDDAGEEVTEINRQISPEVFEPSFRDASTEFQLAACAAEFSEILRKSYWAKGSTLDDLMPVAKRILMNTEDKDVIELVDLISKAQTLETNLAEK